MLIDVSMPITTGAVFREGTPPVDIATRALYNAVEGEYQAVMLSLPAHTATHVDLVFPERSLAPDRMLGSGKLLDATRAEGKVIRLADVQGQVALQAGDFVFVRTDWSRFAGTDRYVAHPELDPEVVGWLIGERVNAVGIDALGLGLDRRHGEYDRLLNQHDIFVIENLVNLDRIPAPEFRVYCLPLNLAGVDAIPARVLVEIEERH